MEERPQSIQQATLAGGCFWCIESAFNRIQGVEKALSGYMGGQIENPSYQDICTGNSGHAEVVQITFDSDIVSYETLLTIFFNLHDPTQLNRQGNDVGTQYRSAIFYHNQAQQETAKKVIEKLTKEQQWPSAIVTSLEAINTFYLAESYHQDYVNNNPQNPYCQMLVLPKLAKFQQQFNALLKTD